LKDYGVHNVTERGSEIVIGSKAKFHGGESVLSRTDNLIAWSKLTKQEVIDKTKEMQETSNKIIAEYQREIDEIIAKSEKSNVDYTSEIEEDIKMNGSIYNENGKLDYDKEGYIGYANGTDDKEHGYYDMGNRGKEMVFGK